MAIPAAGLATPAGLSWYMALGGGDPNDCLRPTTPCGTINAAIGKASSGDTVYVAAGTHAGSGSSVVLTGKSMIFSGGWNAAFTVHDGLSTVDGWDSRGGLKGNGKVTVVVEHFTFRGRHASDSGGIYTSGTVTVSNSTFSGNRAATGPGGGINSGGTLTVSNSTFSGNSASTTGGGIANEGTLTVSNSTFAGNSAGTNGGGIGNLGGTVTLQNTIVANSSAGGNCFGAIINGGGNLSYPDASCPGINSDPMLGPLQSNGGPTRTMALLPGSAAIDAANDGICAAAPVNNLDQRGVTRPLGPHCDIGAFEATLQPMTRRAFLPIIMR